MLLLAGAFLKLLPFRFIAPLFGRIGRGRPAGGLAADPRVVAVARALTATARRLPWGGVCLPRAMAASFMLRMRGIPSHLCLGMRREGGKLEAHAWLIVDGRAGGMVCGGTISESFIPIATLQSDGPGSR